MNRRPHQAAARLWQQIPRWLRAQDEHGNLAGLVAALGIGLDAAREDIERLLDDGFIDTCAPELIPLFGDLVGQFVDASQPIGRQRHMVKYAIRQRRLRGSRENLLRRAWQMSGGRVSLEEESNRLTPGAAPALALSITGASPPDPALRCRSLLLSDADLHMTLRPSVPCERILRELVPTQGGQLHAVHPSQPVGLRSADGTCILITDPPDEADVEIRPHYTGRPLREDFPTEGAWSAGLSPVGGRPSRLGGGIPRAPADPIPGSGGLAGPAGAARGARRRPGAGAGPPPRERAVGSPAAAGAERLGPAPHPTGHPRPPPAGRRHLQLLPQRGRGAPSSTCSADRCG